MEKKGKKNAIPTYPNGSDQKAHEPNMMIKKNISVAPFII